MPDDRPPDCPRCGAGESRCPCAEVAGWPDDAPVSLAWRSLKGDARGAESGGAPMPKAEALARADGLNRFYEGYVMHFLMPAGEGTRP